MLIKYENLIQDQEKEIVRIVNFISKFTKINCSPEKIKKIIDTTSFNSLKKMEESGEFNEYKDKYRKFNFFNKGPENKWENFLDEEIKKEIELKYSSLMEKLGYL